MPDARANPPKARGAVSVCIIAACAIAAPLAAKWEGYSPTVYKDAAGIPTYCYGETEMLRHDPSRIYAKTECMALLRQRMQTDYAPQIAECLPEIIGNRYVFGSLIDASYNAGPVAVCRSPMAQLIKAGKVSAACDRLPSWYVTAQRRVNGKRVGNPFLLKGLVNRRNDEKAVCLRGAA